MGEGWGTEWQKCKEDAFGQNEENLSLVMINQSLEVTDARPTTPRGEPAAEAGPRSSLVPLPWGILHSPGIPPCQEKGIAGTGGGLVHHQRQGVQTAGPIQAQRPLHAGHFLIRLLQVNWTYCPHLPSPSCKAGVMTSARKPSRFQNKCPDLGLSRQPLKCCAYGCGEEGPNCEPEPQPGGQGLDTCPLAGVFTRGPVALFTVSSPNPAAIWGLNGLACACVCLQGPLKRICFLPGQWECINRKPRTKAPEIAGSLLTLQDLWSRL